jgi:hypothetical protein
VSASAFICAVARLARRRQQSAMATLCISKTLLKLLDPVLQDLDASLLGGALVINAFVKFDRTCARSARFFAVAFLKIIVSMCYI